MGYDHCFLCGRHLRPLKVGASIQKRGLDIIRGPDGTVPTEAIERILCQKVMAPGEQNVHLLPSQGDCYKHLVTVRNTLLAEKSAEEQRFESQRQTRKQALESGPPLPEVAPPRAPRAKLSAAESAARDAADATASFGGPRLGEMNINGASIPLVDGERKTRLQASIEQMATDVVFAQLDHEAVMAAAGVDPDIVAAVDGMIEQVERELMPPPPKPPKDASKPWQPRSVAARPAPDKKKGIPHKNTTLKKYSEVALLKKARTSADEVNKLVVEVRQQRTQYVGALARSAAVLEANRDLSEQSKLAVKMLERTEKELERAHERLVGFDTAAETLKAAGHADIPALFALGVNQGVIDVASFFTHLMNDQMRNVFQTSGKTNRYCPMVRDVLAFANTRQSPARALETLMGNLSKPEQAGLILPSIKTLSDHVRKDGGGAAGAAFGRIIEANVQAFLAYQDKARASLLEARQAATAATVAARVLHATGAEVGPATVAVAAVAEALTAGVLAAAELAAAELAAADGAAASGAAASGAAAGGAAAGGAATAAEAAAAAAAAAAAEAAAAAAAAAAAEAVAADAGGAALHGAPPAGPAPPSAPPSAAGGDDGTDEEMEELHNGPRPPGTLPPPSAPPSPAGEVSSDDDDANAAPLPEGALPPPPEAVPPPPLEGAPPPPEAAPPLLPLGAAPFAEAAAPALECAAASEAAAGGAEDEGNAGYACPHGWLHGSLHALLSITRPAHCPHRCPRSHPSGGAPRGPPPSA